MRPYLSVIVPCYNEEANVQRLYDRLSAVMAALAKPYELIFVNDGSRDRTMELIRALAEKDARVRFICLSRNFGHQIAVTAGLDASLGQRIAIIDADLQDPPELIGEMMAKMDEGYEVVYARRRQRKGDSWLKKFTARIFYRILARITSVEIPVDTGDFRLIDRKIVEVLKKMPEQQKYLRGQIAWAGFRQTYVEFDRDGRAGGKTGYTVSKMLRLAMDGITSFSDFPLRFATMAGFVVSGLSFLIILYALISYFILGDTVRGWTSMLVSVMFIGGIQLIAIGIIGEYISRLSANVRNRPLYIVMDSNIPDENQSPTEGQPQ